MWPPIGERQPVDYHAAMLNIRLTALLVLLACVVSPLAFHWVTSPGGSWLRPYIAWLLVIIATWLWQRRRFNEHGDSST